MDARTMDYSIGPTTPMAANPTVLLSHLVEPPGKITGITRYAFGLFEAMLRRRNNRYILTTAWDASDLPAAIRDNLDGIITLPYVRSTPLNILQQTRHLRKIVRQTQADYIYSVNPMGGIVPGVASAITIHDLYYDIQPELYTRRHLLWWRSYFRFLAHHAQAIACISANTTRDLARFHPHLADKSAIVPGAGVLPHQPGASKSIVGNGQPYVLILGNVTPNKNIGFFVEALKQLAANGQPVRAIHVGQDHSGELGRALQQAPAGLIERCGGLSDAELEDVLLNAAALVQPSLFEGFGLPIIEAQERGVAVIASDIPVFREVAGNGADFIHLGDVNGLAAALYRVVSDRGYQSALAKKALANAPRYSWDLSAAAAEQVIANRLTGKKARELAAA